jgi:hypothetical protein
LPPPEAYFRVDGDLLWVRVTIFDGGQPSSSWTDEDERRARQIGEFLSAGVRVGVLDLMARDSHGEPWRWGSQLGRLIAPLSFLMSACLEQLHAAARTGLTDKQVELKHCRRTPELDLNAR